MKYKNIVFSFFILANLFNFTFAQQNPNLYIPRNIKGSYEAGIRTYNGMPGPKYWQNHSDYKINVELFPDSSMISGEEVIIYHNNSPDSLSRLVIRLYQDIMTKGALRDFPINFGMFTEGVKIDYLIIDSDTVDITPESKRVRRHSTNMIVRLSRKLAPGETLEIKTKWNFKMPEHGGIRMGNYGDGDFFIAYWYPQIAVFDDIDGWDLIRYQGIVEFYNDFSNFDVNITVPGRYTVWATGELQNAQEVYKPEILRRYKLAQTSDETIRIISAKDRAENNVTVDNEKNIWHFIAKNVTDFSFAVSKNFSWDAASIEVDRQTGRRVVTEAVGMEDYKFFDEAAQVARTTIEYLSFELPGYPYPYSHTTTFFNKNRGGGMETPMMANDGQPKSRPRFIGLVFHEIAHSYFPFFMGVNERKYAWMDEGWASFFPQEIVDKMSSDYDYLKNNVRSYEYAAGMEAELPPMVVSYSNKTGFSRTAFYSRPANAYRELMHLLGRDLFKKALKEYIYRWNGKHPLPYDFFFTFNDVTGEDLSWFWKPWFYEFGYPDLAIKKVNINGNEIEAIIEKLGNIPTRVELTFEFNDGTKDVTKLSARTWKNSTGTVRIKYITKKKLNKIVLGSKYIPDANRNNNVYIVE